MGLASARKNAGLTQTEAAEALGIDASAISMWESGKTKPRWARIEKLIGLYGCTVDELLADDSGRTMQSGKEVTK